jgi:hypothetical protein
LGQRYFKTAFGKSSTSEKKTASHPSGFQATDGASIPLQTEANFKTNGESTYPIPGLLLSKIPWIQPTFLRVLRVGA